MALGKGGDPWSLVPEWLRPPPPAPPRPPTAEERERADAAGWQLLGMALSRGA